MVVHICQAVDFSVSVFYTLLHFGTPKESFQNGVSMKFISSLMPAAFLFLKALYPLNISFFHLDTNIQIKIMYIYDP